MPFVIVGAILVLMKWFEVDPITNLAWWWVLAPFGLAVVWWAYADGTGLTQRRAIRRMEEKRQQRRERDMVALGLSVQSDRRAREQRRTAEAAKEQIAQRSGKDE